MLLSLKLGQVKIMPNKWVYKSTTQDIKTCHEQLQRGSALKIKKAVTGTHHAYCTLWKVLAGFGST